MNSKVFKTIVGLLFVVFMVSPYAFAGEFEVLTGGPPAGKQNLFLS